MEYTQKANTLDEQIDPGERDFNITSKSHLPCQCMEGKDSLSYKVKRPFFEDPSNAITMNDLIANLMRKLTPEERYEIMDPPPLKFLDVSKLTPEEKERQDLVMLASYPRSGNTLLRAYIEKITGLATGSESSLGGSLNKQLMDLGFEGEGLFDKRINVVKTHYPERFGEHRFLAQKCILEVRNPLDCIASLFNMMVTSTHTHSVSEDDFVKYAYEWCEFIE